MTPKCIEARELALALMAEWGLYGWRFGFNRSKRMMGICYHPWRFPPRTGLIQLSTHYVEHNPVEKIRDTILHEIAHALCGPHEGHGPRWKKACIRVGAVPKRCSDAQMPDGKYQAQCPACGLVYHKHKRPKAASYWCRPCGPNLGILIFTMVA